MKKERGERDVEEETERRGERGRSKEVREERERNSDRDSQIVVPVIAIKQISHTHFLYEM